MKQYQLRSVSILAAGVRERVHSVMSHRGCVLGSLKGAQEAGVLRKQGCSVLGSRGVQVGSRGVQQVSGMCAAFGGVAQFINLPL